MHILKKEEIYPYLLKASKKAEKYILISSPWIKLDVLKEILKDVPIKIILRTSQLEDLLITDKGLFKFVKEKKGEIFLNPDIHAKFVIIDGKEAVVGSANITDAGLLEDGNIETAVVLKDKKEIQKLERIFYSIAENSINLFSEITGVILNCQNSRTGEGILFDAVPEQTYIKIPISKGAFYLGRIGTVKDISSSFFSSFYTFLSKGVFSDPQKLKKIFTEKDKYWRIAAVFAYLNENNPDISLCNIEILAEFNPEKIREKESILKTPVVPPISGSPFFLLKKEEEIEDILKINHSGYPMGKPVPFGKLFNTSLKAYLDLEKIYTMHMAVLGTTGSGKTTFVRRMLENSENTGVTFFIFDLYGEYYNFLKEAGVKSIKNISFENTIFPITANQIKEIFKNYGIPIQEKSLEEKRVVSFFRLSLKPDITANSLKEKTLEDIIIEASQLTEIDSPLRNEMFILLDLLKEDYGEKSVENQPKISDEILNSLKSEEKIIIFDFKEIENPQSRINIAGLIMKEIFKKSREDRKKRIVILEEAQNFAPEKGFGEIEAGSGNLSYTMARKIATEGRKFNLGLVAITQRPANISKYVLSQLNTQVIFKLTNRNDLEAVSSFFEYSKEDIFSLLPFLKPGNGYITGLAVPFGMFIEIKLG
jgi:DNA helicase HerA-like ATPase